MTFNTIRINRNYGYEVLINTFEPFLRNFIINEILIPEYSKEWKTGIPQGIFTYLARRNEDILGEDTSIDDFFEELTFFRLHRSLIFKGKISLLFELSKLIARVPVPRIDAPQNPNWAMDSG